MLGSIHAPANQLKECNTCPEQAADCVQVELSQLSTLTPTHVMHIMIYMIFYGCMCHVLIGVLVVLGYGIGKLATMCVITSCWSGTQSFCVKISHDFSNLIGAANILAAVIKSGSESLDSPSTFYC